MSGCVHKNNNGFYVSYIPWNPHHILNSCWSNPTFAQLFLQFNISSHYISRYIPHLFHSCHFYEPTYNINMCIYIYIHTHIYIPLIQKSIDHSASLAVAAAAPGSRASRGGSRCGWRGALRPRWWCSGGPGPESLGIGDVSWGFSVRICHGMPWDAMGVFTAIIFLARPWWLGGFHGGNHGKVLGKWVVSVSRSIILTWYGYKSVWYINIDQWYMGYETGTGTHLQVRGGLSGKNQGKHAGIYGTHVGLTGK